MAVLIKRYANRKLYNTETSRYITLKGIAELLNEGTEVRVIDNATGEDITSVALSQILVDSKRSNTSPPNTLMSQIFGRSGDALYDVLKRGVDDATDGIGELQERMRRIVGQEESRRQAQAAGETEAGDDDDGTDSDGRRDSRRASNWISQASPDFEQLVQNAVERVFRLLDLPRRSDITALNRNLDRVASAIETLEKAYARRDSRPPREGPAPPP
jgi:polyhydroxyalkanoate synthesis repressor PhaR